MTSWAVVCDVWCAAPGLLPRTHCLAGGTPTPTGSARAQVHGAADTAAGGDKRAVCGARAGHDCRARRPAGGAMGRRAPTAAAAAAPRHTPPQVTRTRTCCPLVARPAEILPAIGCNVRAAASGACRAQPCPMRSLRCAHALMLSCASVCPAAPGVCGPHAAVPGGQHNAALQGATHVPALRGLGHHRIGGVHDQRRSQAQPGALVRVETEEVSRCCCILMMVGHVWLLCWLISLIITQW